MKTKARSFISYESMGGIVLAIAALAALVVANSDFGDGYRALLDVRGEVRIAAPWLVLAKPLHVWVNDLWMAVFFFLVGLEIKRELLAGELQTPRQALLPAVAAVGGMVVPALIYVAFNAGGGVALRGWAIPAATDIAFALGVLAVLGSRVPASLKIFLTAVAIIDDLGAIVVIAAFYTDQVSLLMLGAALAGGGVLFALNRLRVPTIGAYVLVGLVVWLFVLKSGVHATLAGVVTAFAVPLRARGGATPLETTEHALHPWVAFGILPAFAFVNAGVSLEGIGLGDLAHGVPLGIAAGLLFGKVIGVGGAAWLAIRFLGARLPEGARPLQFAGVAVLCGIGFTMSLFIGGLAFGDDARYATLLKLGVLGGSLLSALIGAGILIVAARPSAASAAQR